MGLGPRAGKCASGLVACSWWSSPAASTSAATPIFPYGSRWDPEKLTVPGTVAARRYIDRVNITNIREAPRVRVQRSYVNIVNVTNVTYINREHGATGMRHDDFASGRSGRNVAVRVDPREMQQARVLQQPNIAPSPRAIVSRPVAHPVPVSIQRPLLINQQGRQITAKPGAVPVAAPVRNEPHVRPLPGRTVVAAPAHGVPNRVGGNQFPPTQGNQNQRPDATIGGVPRANPVAPVQGVQRPLNPQPGNPQANPNPPANPNQRQQPNERQQQVPQPVAPGVQPTGRPIPPPQNMQQDRTNPQNAPYPGGAPRANPVAPGQGMQRPVNPQANPNPPANPNERQQVPQPVAPGVQPTGRPIPAPQNMQQDRPNNQQRNYEHQQQQQNQPPPQNQREPQNRPPQQIPQPPQNQPERQNHQEFGPPQLNRHNDVAPPPANNPPQERQAPPPQHQREVMPPQRPVPQPQERPAPPPQQQQREAVPPQRPQHQERPAPPPPSHQVAPPPQQNKPQPNNQKPPNNKDQKKDDKKHD